MSKPVVRLFASIWIVMLLASSASPAGRCASAVPFAGVNLTGAEMVKACLATI